MVRGVTSVLMKSFFGDGVSKVRAQKRIHIIIQTRGICSLILHFFSWLHVSRVLLRSGRRQLAHRKTCRPYLENNHGKTHNKSRALPAIVINRRL